jgi:acyl-CoA hydrolase
MASVAGSSSVALICVASRMWRSVRTTSSSARIDFSRPTNSGTIMCGNTTISRSGKTA